MMIVPFSISSRIRLSDRIMLYLCLTLLFLRLRGQNNPDFRNHASFLSTGCRQQNKTGYLEDRRGGAVLSGPRAPAARDHPPAQTQATPGRQVPAAIPFS